MQIVDAKGLKCPMPVIKLQQATRQMQRGEQLEIIATDKAVCQDIPCWCRINKHRILSEHHTGEEYRFTIEVNA
jgi:tRNA 2-thiouridine synthesizing protein A